MKYREGDLVRIKSKAWWERQEKNRFNTIWEGNKLLSFDSEMAEECCGEIGEVRKSDFEIYCVRIENKLWYFSEDWIERGVEKIDINLRLMKIEL